MYDEATADKQVLRLVRTGTAARIWVSRPESRNAISLEVMRRFEEVLDEVEKDPPVVLSIQGSGQRAFVSGGDLKEFSAIRTANGAAEMAVRMRTILDRVASLPCLTIAELNGHALGGGAELAIAADIRIAASDVKIGFSQVRLAITPAWGGIERLAELVGRARSLYLICTGTAISADQALGWGLVEEVVERASFDDRVEALSAEVAAHPGEIVRFMKAITSEVCPSVHGRTAGQAIEGFAASWAAETHWSAAAESSANRKAPR
jgi:enoyl-CoA hydratase/carnithine racemase